MHILLKPSTEGYLLIQYTNKGDMKQYWTFKKEEKDRLFEQANTILEERKR